MRTNTLANYLLYVTVALSLGITLVSCHKEISNNIDFIGLWREKGKVNGATLEFTRNDTAYLTIYNNVHKYRYWVDEKLGYIYFSVYDNPESEWRNKYFYDVLSKELTIWGLYISIPENPSKTIFTRD